MNKNKTSRDHFNSASTFTGLSIFSTMTSSNSLARYISDTGGAVDLQLVSYLFAISTAVTGGISVRNFGNGLAAASESNESRTRDADSEADSSPTPD